MARSIAKPTLAALLLAEQALGFTGWYTWAPHGLSPHFAYQDPGSGHIYHSACNSNETAIFPTDEPLMFDLNVQPRAASPLGVRGWWDDELETTVAYLFYQIESGAIMNAYFECNYETGEYELDPEGEYSVSDDSGAPSVHERSGLSVEELGDVGGWRILYHDEDERVNMLAYDDDTDWTYLGPVSRMTVSGMSIASTIDVDSNLFVSFPHDDANIAFAQFNESREARWSLSSLPTAFSGSAPSNRTNPADIELETEDAPFSLASFDAGSSHLAMAMDSAPTQKIFYIGTDRRLHHVFNLDGTWEVADSQDEDVWPRADDENAQMAVVSEPDSGQVWLYYHSGGNVMELHQDGFGSWADAQVPMTRNASAPTPAPTPTPSAEPTNNPEENTSDGGSGGDLSTGAQAGIGVGVTVAVLGAAAAAWFCLRRRNRTPQPETVTTHSGEHKLLGGIRGFYPRGSGRGDYDSMHDGRYKTGAVELTSATAPQELAADTHHELAADGELGGNTFKGAEPRR